MKTLKNNIQKKLRFIAVVGCALAGSVSSRAATSSCLTTSIDISTGLNAGAAALYPYSSGSSVVLDAWWQVTMVPDNTIGYTTPQCAELVDNSMVTGTGLWSHFSNAPTAGSPLGSHYISFISQCGEPPYGSLPSGGSGGGFLRVYNYGPTYGPKTDSSGKQILPVRFTRKFYIAGSTPQTVTINLAGYGDDIIFAAVDGIPGVPLFVGTTSPTIPSTSAPYYLYYQSSVSTTTTPMSISQSYTLAPGYHTIDIDLYDISGKVEGLNIIGNITCRVPALMGSTCYGENSCCLCPKGAKSSEILSGNSTTQADNNVLYQNTPNPFNGQTTIGYFVQQIQQNAFIAIRDMNGNELMRYPVTTPGHGQVTVNMNNLQPGIYVYALIVDGRQFDIKKMTVL